MKRWVMLSLITVLGPAAGGCESGWDLTGRVVTANAPDKNRPLYVYMVNDATIDAAALTTGADSIPYAGMNGIAMIPVDDLTFEEHAFGCHRGSVAVVAWAPLITPAPAPAPGPARGPAPPFKPQSGDYVVASSVRHPYCGWATHVENVVLVLDGQTYF